MDTVLGMGEVGSTVYDLLVLRGYGAVGTDVDPSRCREPSGPDGGAPGMLHVCIPGGMASFGDAVLACVRSASASAVLIHSTVPPGTAASLQKSVDAPVVSAPARGVHRRFLEDMQRYTKFVASDAEVPDDVRRGIRDRFKKVKWMSGTRTLEMAKILTDTTYYGWLINFAQITKMVCDREGIDYDEMWSFAEEAHEFLGNRPKMRPGVIGGHCVLPNLELLDYPQIQAVRQINDAFREFSGEPA